MASPKSDTEYYTYKDYATWPESERWQIIAGQALAMTAPSRKHQKVVTSIGAQIYNQIGSTGCEVYVAPFDVRLPKSDEADAQIDTIVQPDISIICDKGKLDDKGMRGAPTVVFEVLSDSTSQLDQTTKLELYQEHGVKEYWIIHPTEKVVYVRYLEGSTYGKALILTDKDSLALKELPSISINLAEALAD